MLPFTQRSHPSDRRRGPVAGRTRRRAFAGQSVVEFALLLPVLLALVGATVDFARLYQGWVNLESATRDAAQYLSTSNTDSLAADYTVPNATADSTNDAKAKYILDTAVGTSFTRSTTATLGTCASPTVTTITSAINTSPSAGGSPSNPVQNVEVLACVPFRTLFAYPWLTTNGNWILRSDRTYTVIVGR
jgi:Flp pilus assembly protein TadG